MKNLKLFILLCSIYALGCDKEDIYSDRIIGRWQLVKVYSLMNGGFYSVKSEQKRIDEYKKNNECIRFDYMSNEISRCNYIINDTKIIIFGNNLNGQEWKYSYDYWINNDTLKIHYDGGFEFYDEFLIKIR